MKQSKIINKVLIITTMIIAISGIIIEQIGKHDLRLLVMSLALFFMVLLKIMEEKIDELHTDNN